MKNRNFQRMAILSIIICVSYSHIIQIPSITMPNELSIRLHEVFHLQVPNYNFKQVYRKEVKIVQDSFIMPFDGCQVRDPFVGFATKIKTKLKRGIQKPIIIRNIEDIVNGKNILDAIYLDHQVYIMSSNGQLIVITLSHDMASIQLLGYFDVQVEKLSQGYFFKHGLGVCFANANYVFVISRNGFDVLTLKYNHFLDSNSYQDQERFQSVVALTAKHFAVLIKDIGVQVYSLEGDTLKKEFQISKEAFGYAGFNSKLSLVDMQYDRNYFRLYVLDQLKGVSIFVLSLENDLPSFYRLPHYINIYGCNLLYMRKTQLYSSCRDGLISVELENWPQVSIHHISDSKIKVQEIYETWDAAEDLLIVAGHSAFEIFYHGKLAEYVRDRSLDKLLMIGNNWISINENSVSMGIYQVFPERIECRMDLEEYVGRHTLMVKTQANCDAAFLKLNNIDFTLNFAEKDTCVYTTYVQVAVWLPGEVAMMPVAITMTFLVVSIWVIMLGWCITKLKEMAVSKELQEYSHLAQGEHVVFVEEEEKPKNKHLEMQSPVIINEADNGMHDIE